MDVKKRVKFLSWVVGAMAVLMVAFGFLFKSDIQTKIDAVEDKITEENKDTTNDTTTGDDVVTDTVNNLAFYA